jgi:uncharacterized protein (DUF983 family)
MLWRGLRRRCPWCGGRTAFFTGWFAKQDHCRTCGISVDRGYEGFELGAATINAIVTLGVVVVGLAIGAIATSPDIPVIELTLGLGVVAIALPIALYPVSYTVWQAVDLAMRPPERSDADVPPPRR